MERKQQVWAIRFWLDHKRRVRDRAMFDFTIDRKLRGCDIVKIKIGDLISGGNVRPLAINVSRKPVGPSSSSRLSLLAEAFLPGLNALTAD